MDLSHPAFAPHFDVFALSLSPVALSAVCYGFILHAEYIALNARRILIRNGIVGACAMRCSVERVMLSITLSDRVGKLGSSLIISSSACHLLKSFRGADERNS